MKKVVTKFIVGISSFILFCTMAVQVHAEGTAMVVEKYATDTEIVLYVTGVDGNIEEVSYQVGTTPCNVENVEYVNNIDEGIYTLILWDNSISVMNRYEESIKEILKDVVANRAAGEQFAIATLGESVTYLTEYTGDYTSLKQIIDNVEAENKDAYIVENIYAVVEKLNTLQGFGYKRIILISDGMDVTEIGYSRDELDELLENTPYPIHTIGVLSQSGQDELQEMFSLSRASGVDYFYLDEIEDTLSVVQGLSINSDIIQVRVAIPEHMRDGSTQNSLLSIVSGSEVYQVQCEVKLPFLVPAITEEAIPNEEEVLEELETVPSIEEESITEEESVTEDVEASEEILEENLMKRDTFLERKITIFGMECLLIVVIGCGVGVAILLLTTILLIISKRKKKRLAEKNANSSYEVLEKKLKNERNLQEEQREFVNTPANVQETPAGFRNVQISNAVQPGWAGVTNSPSVTQRLFDENVKPSYPEYTNTTLPVGHWVVLTNVSDPAQTYQCNLNDKIVIGRNSGFANIAIMSDNAVSERHCEISVMDNKCYIKDLGSSNGTKVNGRRIDNPTEVTSGCILKLGRLEYRLTID